MKKLIIIFLSLLLSFSVQADEERLKEFDKWLIKNKFSEFVDIEFAQIKEKCKSINFVFDFSKNQKDLPRFK